MTTPFVHFTALPRANDYRALCDDDGGETPACADAAVDLRFTVDALGNLAVPMSWSAILRDRPGTSKKDNRAVRGSTAVPARSSATAPIDVPGAAFLASFTPQGTRFPTDPPFAPEHGAPGRGHELVLAGEADQPASVLWMWRRRAWDHACDSGPRAGQACEPATAGGDCGGPYRCVQTASPVFYSCRGGAREGLPCTRQSHCGPGTTTCEAGAVCVARASGVPGGSACKTDLDCAAHEECGNGLFEFRDRLAGGSGPIIVPKDAPPGKEGVCRGGGKDGDRCSAACGPDRCVLFRTEAKGYKSRP